MCWRGGLLGYVCLTGLASSLPNQVLVKEKENKESRTERLPTWNSLLWMRTRNVLLQAVLSLSIYFQLYLVPILLYSVYTEFFIFLSDHYCYIKCSFTTSFTILDSLIYNLSWVWKEVSLRIHFGSDMYWQR